MIKRDLCSTSSSEWIVRYSESKIAKSETGDCVVRSFATSFGVDYDESHTFVANKFNRHNRRGTPNFVPTMNSMSRRGETLWGKKLLKLGGQDMRNSMTYTDGDKVRKMTTFQFLKRYPKGTYMVNVRRHAFTIKDGVVIGNHEDILKTKKVILHAWEITQ